MKYQPELCSNPDCGQTLTYLLGLDRCSFLILRKLLEAVSRKGVNEVHPTRDVQYTTAEKWLPSNVTRPRKHGLIAFVKGKKGYYAITKKGGKLLRMSEYVPRYAIISKATQHTVGYFEPEERQVCGRELLLSDELPLYEGELAQAGAMLDVIDPREPANFNKPVQVSLFHG